MGGGGGELEEAQENGRRRWRMEVAGEWEEALENGSRWGMTGTGDIGSRWRMVGAGEW